MVFDIMNVLTKENIPPFLQSQPQQQVRHYSIFNKLKQESVCFKTKIGSICLAWLSIRINIRESFSKLRMFCNEQTFRFSHHRWHSMHRDRDRVHNKILRKGPRKPLSQGHPNRRYAFYSKLYM